MNSGDVTAAATIQALGISGETRGDGSPLSIVPRRQRERLRLRRDVPYNLDRNLESTDFQSGFVNGTLDYDNISRAFDFEGGQVGGYATYLRGGLFVDSPCQRASVRASPARSMLPRWG